MIFKINGLNKSAIFISDVSKGKFALLFKRILVKNKNDEIKKENENMKKDYEQKMNDVKLSNQASNKLKNILEEIKKLSTP